MHSMGVLVVIFLEFFDVNNLDFIPRNEGEKAKYIFEIVPTSLIKSSMYIIVIFPAIYDPNLGPYIKCSV